MTTKLISFALVAAVLAGCGARTAAPESTRAKVVETAAASCDEPPPPPVAKPSFDDLGAGSCTE
jgi:hypothetical protein